MHDLSVILESTSRLAVPLLFVALGELIAERAGTLNLSVEAMMLGSAFGAVALSDVMGSPVLGLIGGVGCGLLIAIFQAEFSHRLTVNQFLIGIALNILVLGLTGYLFATYQIVPHIFHKIEIPLLHQIPIVGKALFGQPAPFYAIYALVPALGWLLWRSRWGLEVRAAGEDPDAATLTGVRVNRRRRESIYLCGLCAGYGGAYLSIGVVGSFSPNMTAGRGFIAIAAVIFGAWTMKGTIAGCIVFGAADALRLALPALGYQFNAELLISAPYLLALVAMILFVRRNRQPAALGLTYTGAAS
jgi:general nucleoside transport system permease protein